MKFFKQRAGRAICLALVTVFAAFATFAACDKKEENDNVIKTDENSVVISPSSDVLELTATTTLAEYLDALAEKGDFEYVMENGMVISINGLAQDAENGKYWMLYTSDEDKSNSAWGIAEHEGKRYGSAAEGASTLVIKAGELYIWCYQGF